jgi:hypothetical protein
MQTDLLMGLTGEVKDIVIEVIRAANSNPVIGVFVAIVGVDVLYRLKLIGATSVVAILAFLGVIEGGSVAANLIDAAGNFIGDIGQLIPSIGSKTINQASQADLVTPSATNLNWTVLTEEKTSRSLAGDAAILGLVNRIKSK